MTETQVLHRNPNVIPPTAKAGRTQFIIATEDVSLTPIVDLSCGAGVACLGHSARGVKLAMNEQISLLAYAHSAQFTTDTIEMAAALVISMCEVRPLPGRGVDHNPFTGGGVTFFSGGAEAVEAAVKIGLQHLQHKGKGPFPIMARQHSYHGNSFFTLALGDHPRKSVLKSAFNATCHVERFDAYAPLLFAPALTTGENHAYRSACLQSLERQLSLNSKYHRSCVVVIETVAGTTLAIAPPDVEYLMGVRRLCDAFDAVLIYDEILCANFRTGRMTAWQYYQERAGLNLAPDIFVMGKGITAGYFPMSAVVVSEKIRATCEDMGRVWHTSTNQNHPVGCAALLAAFDRYLHLIGSDQHRMLSNTMLEGVGPTLLECPAVIGVDGVGLLWGVRFAGDKPGLHLAVKRELLARGYSVYSDGGTVDGKGNMIMFAPPYVMDTDDLIMAGKAVALSAVSANNQ
jgi:adenosylmethionine-8-amino-7-oxononanoate aminotransferase